MTDESESLRPKGTVEVQCSHADCGIAWWLDPLDPRLPDGPFDCGDDHETTKILRRRLALLHLRHGLRWGHLVPLGEAKEGSTEACASRSASKGVAIVYDREGASQKRGAVVWETLRDLNDIDKVAESVLWDVKDWPEAVRESDPIHSQREEVPEGHVRWVGYKTNEEVRRYTFVPCARFDCPHEVMVDIQDTSFRPMGYMVGSWGGGTMPAPAWWGRQVRCEDGLGTFGTQPCELVRCEAIAQFEQASRSHWTIWDNTTQGSKRPPQTAVLFHNRHENRYGVLLYSNRETFTTSARIAQAIQWGPFPELERIIGFSLLPGQRSSILEELETQSRLPS